MLRKKMSRPKSGMVSNELGAPRTTKLACQNRSTCWAFDFDSFAKSIFSFSHPVVAADPGESAIAKTALDSFVPMTILRVHEKVDSWCCLLRVSESGSGTFEARRMRWAMSEFEGKAEDISSHW
jgi:hypothetical protein